MNFTVLIIVMGYIVLTYLIGLLYKLAGWKFSKYIQRNLGWTGYCVFGTVGVTYHELSHLITAVLFRHKIIEVRLFRPFQGRIDGTLGYVNHSYNSRSIYQKAGNFFIGTASMLFGAGLLLLLLRFAYPSGFVITTEMSEIPNSLRLAFLNMLNPSYLLTIWTPLILLIAVFISPYMDMSWADIKEATSGAIALVLVAILFSKNPNRQRLYAKQENRRRPRYFDGAFPF